MVEELAFKDEAAAEYDRTFAHVTAHFMPFLSLGSCAFGWIVRSAASLIASREAFARSKAASHPLRSYALSAKTSVPTNSLNPKPGGSRHIIKPNAEPGCIKVVDTFRLVARGIESC
jgi:hypothetical protein